MKSRSIAGEAKASSAEAPARSGIIQRKCACGQHTGGGECASCRKNASGERQQTVSQSGRPAETSTHVTSFRRDFSGIRTLTADSGKNESPSVSPGIPADLKTETQGGGPTGGADAGPSAEPFCKVTGSFEDIPSGKIAATLNANTLGAAFKMVGNFDSHVPCTCSCGEYRQYVRGKFTSNGQPVAHSLGGGRTLHPVNFQEDGDVAAGTVYGHRSVLGTKSEFKPDQAGGCRFEGADEPGIASSTTGTVLGIDLDFKGDLIDTCRSNTAVASSAWNVAGSATIP